MPRQISTELARLLRDGGGYAVATARVAFPDGVRFFAGENIWFDGQEWEGRIVKVGAIRTSQGRAIDRAALTLANADYALSQQIFRLQRNFQRVRVTVGEAWFDERLVFVQHLILMNGEIGDLSETDTEIEMEIVSDIAARRGVVGRVISLRCDWRYKSPECGYTGDLPPCNKRLLGMGGCEGRSNTHRFGGAVYTADVGGASPSASGGSVPSAVSNQEIQGSVFGGGGVQRVQPSLDLVAL
jgi:hypothetical protein